MSVKIYSVKKDGETKITANFKVKEFRSYSDTYNKLYTDEVKVDVDFVKHLQQLRDLLGKSIIIVNGYRCPAHNKAVGGAANSKHTLGCAADIKASGFTSKELCCIAQELGFDGIARISNSNVHLDDGTRIYKGDEMKGHYNTVTNDFYKYFGLKAADIEKKLKKTQYTVTANLLNIRKGAGTNYAVAGTYKKGTVISVTYVRNGWGKTDRGWISLTYCEKK